MSESRRKHSRRDSPEERSSYRRDRRSSPRAERESGNRNRRRSRSPHGRPNAHEHGRRRDHFDDDKRGSRNEHSRHGDRKHPSDVKLVDRRHQRGEHTEHNDHRDKPLHERRPKDGDRLREDGEQSKDISRERHRSGRLEERGEVKHNTRRDRGGEDTEERFQPAGGSDDSRQRRKRRREREQEEDVSQYEFGGGTAQKNEDGKEEAKSDEPDYGLSGKLAAETNTYRGVVINYSEPAEARIPKTRWRLYPFKGDEALSTLYIHRQSAYLIGRDRRICDMPIDHPSCSKQHAVIQYRLVEYTKEDGSTSKRVRPYVLDLESTNGTYLNNQRIEPARYYELKEQDMLKFGFSSREYVILHENSKTDVDPDEAGTESTSETTTDKQ